MAWTAPWLRFRLLATTAPLALLMMLATPPMAGLPAGAKSLNIKDFGARGDGVADDYDAMKAAAAALCSAAGATLTYPPGTYRIARYRVIGGPHANEVTDISYDGCHDATITGDRARIVVTGAFHRAADYVTGRYRFSYTTGVVPFDFLNSSRFTLRGFDINGDVQHTTRDPEVAEHGNGAGIRTGNASDYTIADVHVHHFATDGIYLGGAVRLPGAVKHADRNATLRNVTADHNARNGLSVIQVRGATIIDSTFANNGRTESAYGGHAPRSGVDIEPLRRVPDVDVQTGDIRFLNSRFEENLGIQLVTGGAGPVAIDTVDVENCHVQAQDPGDFLIAFLVSPRVGTVKGCRFDVSSPSGRPRMIWLHALKTSAFPFLTQLTYQDNTFNVDTNTGVISDPRGSSLNISFVGNAINIHAMAPDHTVLKLEGLQTVAGNRFHIDATGYAGARDQIVIRYDGTKTIQGNTYTTNLTDPGKPYRIFYPKDATVRNEAYVGSISR